MLRISTSRSLQMKYIAPLPSRSGVFKGGIGGSDPQFSNRFVKKRFKDHKGGKKGISPHLREFEGGGLKNFSLDLDTPVIRIAKLLLHSHPMVSLNCRFCLRWSLPRCLASGAFFSHKDCQGSRGTLPRLVGSAWDRTHDLRLD